MRTLALLTVGFAAGVAAAVLASARAERERGVPGHVAMPDVTSEAEEQQDG